MTLEQVVAEITQNAQTDAFPSLTPEQVSALATKNMRAAIWTANHTYRIGEVVQPLMANGHFYKCIEFGTSSDIEPIWTRRYLDTVRDGATLVWEESNSDSDGNLYNIRNATHDAWLLKASMAANQFDASIDGQKWNRSQIYEHCLEMARAWSPFD